MYFYPLSSSAEEMDKIYNEMKLRDCSHIRLIRTVTEVGAGGTAGE